MSEARAGRIPYSGVPEVTPRPAPPSFQQIRATPEEFGAEVGQGLQKLGQGLKEASDVYSEVAAQQALTNWRTQVNNVMFGDPSKPGDVGYFGLQGQAAMDARQSTRDRIEQITQGSLGGLSTTRSQIVFNNEARQYQSRLDAEIGSHYATQSDRWAQTVQKNKVEGLIGEAALRPTDESALNDIFAKGHQAVVQGMQSSGELPMDMSTATTDQLQVLHNKMMDLANQITESSVRSSIGRGDLAGASETFKRHIDQLSTSPHFDAIAASLERGTNKAAIRAMGAAIWDGSSPTWGAGGAASGGGATGSGINNPGNIRAPGGGFRDYPTRDAGIQAIRDNLGAYADQHGINTLSGVISRWAPPSENDTPALIKNAAARTGFAPDQKLDLHDQATQAKIVGAIVRQEGNNRTSSAGAPPVRLASNVAPAANRAPIDAQAPDLDEMLSRIPTDAPDEVYRGVFNDVTTRYREWHQSTNGERAALKQSLTGGVAMLNDGRAFSWDEGRIRYLFPKAEADTIVETLNDAQEIGNQKKNIAGTSIGDMLAQDAANQQQLAKKLPAEYERASRMADAYHKAVYARWDALNKDPALQISLENQAVQRAQAAAYAETPEQEAALAKAGQPTLKETFAGVMLDAQQQAGLPPEMRHIFGATDAQQRASKIIGNPEQAPAAIKEYASSYGSAWPQAFRDLVTLGKLPAGYQALALMPEADGLQLSRALAAGRGENKSFDQLLGADRVGQNVKDVRGADGVDDYLSALRRQGASDAQRADVLGSISALANQKTIEKDGDPVANAVKAFIGRYAFLPNGGAWAPSDKEDAVSANMAARLGAVTTKSIRIPPQDLTGVRGAPNADDYVRELTNAPTWINTPTADGVMLLDMAARPVLGRDGNPIVVRFSDPAPPGAAAPQRYPGEPPTPPGLEGPVGTPAAAPHELPQMGEMEGQTHLLPEYSNIGQTRPMGMGEYIRNPNGSWSSEITATVSDPGLNNGRYTVVPTLWLLHGKPTRVTEDRAAELAIYTGLAFRSFKTQAEAESYANKREEDWQQRTPGDRDMPPLWMRSAESER